jgi:hypothetical protein
MKGSISCWTVEVELNDAKERTYDINNLSCLYQKVETYLVFAPSIAWQKEDRNSFKIAFRKLQLE